MGFLTRRLDNNWDMTFGDGINNMARDTEAVAQNAQARVQVIFGEWFLDIGAGVPYLTGLRGYIEAVLKQTIIQSTGILQPLVQFTTSYNSGTRNLEVYALVTNQYGTVSAIRATPPSGGTSQGNKVTNQFGRVVASRTQL